MDANGKSFYPPLSGQPSAPQPYYQNQPYIPPSTTAIPSGPPPPYTPYADTTQMKYNGYQYMPPTAAPAAAPYNYTHGYPTNAYPSTGQYQYNPYPTLPPNSTVVMPTGFDAGARFDGVARPNIPPPPPGMAPNAAQLAAMQGNNVVIGQKKSSFFEGGSSGGYTFW
ncbi:DAZ-associated protein 2-like isoform X2 [Oppia nitens]|uniref:DAZ-associated protein 2-like isoform X2 n=1 Tax=Oppia nitens TaxID=1686743 RepID=UPI0023DB510F|nr:DAZ-associated protein 2-like isoform X2 [Oppia nitens]